MTSKNSRSERLRLSHALSSRERRSWLNRLCAKQEELEKAEEELTRTMASAWKAGMSYDGIGAALGLHGTTIQKRIGDANTAGDHGGGEGSQRP